MSRGNTHEIALILNLQFVNRPVCVWLKVVLELFSFKEKAKEIDFHELLTCRSV